MSPWFLNPWFCRLSLLMAVAFPLHAYAVDYPSLGQSPEGQMQDGQINVGSYSRPQFNQPYQPISSWYLRGDLVYSKTTMPDIDATSGVRTGTTAPNFAGVQMGVGYKFSNWFRTDLTYEYDTKYNSTSTAARAAPATPSAPGNLSCVRAENVNATVDSSGNVTGYTHAGWDAPGCQLVNQFSMARQNILLNAYFDLGQYGPMSPYVGVGIGASVFQTSSTTTAYFADTKQAIGNYGVGQNIISPIANVGPTGSTIGYYSLDAAQARTSYNLAMALHAGLSYDLGSSTSLDVGYRYLHSGNYVPLAGASSATTAGVASHQIHVGLRFLLQ